MVGRESVQVSGIVMMDVGEDVVVVEESSPVVVAFRVDVSVVPPVIESVCGPYKESQMYNILVWGGSKEVRAVKNIDWNKIYILKYPCNVEWYYIKNSAATLPNTPLPRFPPYNLAVDYSNILRLKWAMCVYSRLATHHHP